MKPLGFWNRLAIVATGFALLIGPAWIYVDTVDSINTSKELFLKSCRSQAMAHLGPDGLADWDKIKAADKQCWDNYHQRGEPDGKIWREAFAAILLLCAFLYFLIWGMVATAKWVWRGRSTKST